MPRVPPAMSGVPQYYQSQAPSDSYLCSRKPNLYLAVCMGGLSLDPEPNDTKLKHRLECPQVDPISVASELSSSFPQAVSEAGAGPFGDIAMVTTPPSVPAAVECVEEVSAESVIDITTGASASRLAVTWKEPCCHGAEITGYNIDLGEQLPLSVGRTSHHVLENLQPNSTLR